MVLHWTRNPQVDQVHIRICQTVELTYYVVILLLLQLDHVLKEVPGNKRQTNEWI